MAESVTKDEAATESQVSNPSSGDELEPKLEPELDIPAIVILWLLKNKLGHRYNSWLHLSPIDFNLIGFSPVGFILFGFSPILKGGAHVSLSAATVTTKKLTVQID